jgi:hypothetical protein
MGIDYGWHGFEGGETSFSLNSLGVVPHGLLRSSPCPKGLDISHTCGHY